MSWYYYYSVYWRALNQYLTKACNTATSAITTVSTITAVTTITAATAATAGNRRANLRRERGRGGKEGSGFEPNLVPAVVRQRSSYLLNAVELCGEGVLFLGVAQQQGALRKWESERVLLLCVAQQQGALRKWESERVLLLCVVQQQGALRMRELESAPVAQ